MFNGESGLYIVPDEKEDAYVDDGLHALVCPECGNTSIDGKPIKRYPLNDGRTYVRCCGGFGEKKYIWVPHKCTSCGCKFVAWTTKKSANAEIIGATVCLVIITVIAAWCAALGIEYDHRYLLFLLPYIFGVVLVCATIEGGTLGEDIGPSIISKYSVFFDDEEEEECPY